ncbi:glycosyl hydrolase [Solihabitans fulvus]|uniref:Glycosyl hydrolase n=1 Tax=Solihabitans fulvus TaxID=1892852 RepID=A0A5B2XRM3_9PSEU|nr:discoidin domain-containing protein [Solihabitans fulvus]KAA2266558.1 glycosyl hydrolase [Solihabitans fulvus]
MRRRRTTTGLIVATLVGLAVAAPPIVGLAPPASSAGSNPAPRDTADVPAAASPNLALGRPATASSHTQDYVPGNVTDGNQASYWESTNNVFPQWLQVDLGSSAGVNKLVLKLPTVNWGPRTETLSIQGSVDNTNFATILASAGYAFDGSANTVAINVTTTTARYLRLNFTANTGWPAAQLAELEVYGPSGGDTQPPTAPTNLAVTTPTSGQVALTWGASTDNVGVTSYAIYRNGSLDTTVDGTTLGHTEVQPDSATVQYYVVALDAAGNTSPPSNTVTRQGNGPPSTNLALGKPATGTANTYIYVPGNVTDGDLTTYFEGSTYPSQVTVRLGANADVSSVVVALNPDPVWGPRTQTIEVLGREQNASGVTSIAAPRSYSFDPASGNKVTIPVTARVADVELSITSNSGAPGGQVAELQVFGVPAPNPDLAVTGSSWSPTSPTETDPVTLSATVRNVGTADAAATDVNFYLGNTKVGTAPVDAIAAGASRTVSVQAVAQNAGSYQYTAKVDESKSLIELSYANNNYTNPAALVVAPVQSSDLVAAAVDWTPNNPSPGNTVAFSVALKNQGTIASAGGSHGITLTLVDSANNTVSTLTGSYGGVLAPGASAVVGLGSWTAANGRFTVRTVIAVDANELPVKQGNNTSSASLFVGQGANLPYGKYEAEAGALGGGAAIVGPNRTIGDLAGEASGRQAVTLNNTGSHVQWSSREPTNTIVVRFSIPDAPGGDGTTATLDLYVNDTLVQPLNLTSHYAWLYGAETGPGNSPSAGAPRHIYDEASFLLPASYPAGSVIKLQKDAANTSQYAIDFMELEQATPIANPNPASYLTPAGFGQQDVQNALDKVRMDTTGAYTGVYLPAGQYQTSSKFQVYGKAVRIVGAGPWFTQFSSPSGQSDTDDGFSVSATANGSTLRGFAFFGNYTSRIDGPGKVFDLTDVANLTIDDIWVEHTVCAIWGTHVSGLNVADLRIRDTFADGINFTNGSQNNTVDNSEARSTGDDSFAIFAAQDHNSADLTGNTFKNLTSLLPWRAASFAIYGGDGNTFENLYSADTLTYSGLTLSSLNFNYPFQGFGANPKTVVRNISLVRDGGHFWNGQVFGAIWVFSATQPFQGLRITDATITDPTYSGIMFQTDYVGGTAQNPVQDTIFTNTTITGARQSGDQFDAKSGYGIWANPLPEPNQGPAVGSVTFNGLTERDNHVDIQNTTTTFTITVN